MKVFFFFIVIGALVIIGATLSEQNNSLEQTVAECECNVVLFVHDTLGAKHLGMYGAERDTSPFLDEFFGKNGLVFTHAFSHAPWTVPAFASLYFSAPPSTVTVQDIANKKSDSLPAVLRRNGVRIAHVRFGESGGGVIGGIVASPFTKNEVVYTKEPITASREAIEDLFDSYTQDGTRFFALVHSFVVHDPYDPEPPYDVLFEDVQATSTVTREELKAANKAEIVPTEKQALFKLRYQQEIRELDDQMKHFFENLNPDVLENTIFIVTSDHGEAFGEHGRFWHGSTLFNEEIHVPLLVRVPKPTRNVVGAAVSLSDIAPTILDIFGIPQPNTYNGTNLFSVAAQENTPIGEERVIRLENGRPNFFKARPFPSSYDELTKEDILGPVILPGTTASVIFPWKIIRNKEGTEIYNIKTDPLEQDNLF